ncbi:unnamed protein product [Ophioblennius macclurei]
MMATVGPASASGLLPLLETLEDPTAAQAEQTDAYLTIASRLSGDGGRQFLPAVEKYFCLLGNSILGHMSSSSPELSQAALQALGFCVYHANVAARLSEVFAGEVLSALCSLVVKSTDKNTCTRALWVISKQSFSAAVIATKVASILGSVESVWSREDVQSVVMEHEALNVIIRLLEQVPASMGEDAVRWAKLVVPLVVHSASKVRLRAAAAMEMGMPLFLEKQAEVAAVIEPMMSAKLIPELQKLFMSKNETNVLKLWSLFVKLLGKLLHRGGPFINSLLHLEELGFRSSSPTIKKIAFIAWKSLIDNFALNPDILCSAKRMKLLMQPLASIHVRTEALLLTKVEVWWYLVVQLGPHLCSAFEQVALPLLHCAFGSDSPPASRGAVANGAASPATPKSGFSSSSSSSWLALNVSVHSPSSFPSIQLLGLEMLLHFFLGPEAGTATRNQNLTLSLEPLSHPLLSGASSFNKHAAALISGVTDGFAVAGKDASEALLLAVWTNLLRHVNAAIECGGSKKERQGSEVLTLTLQALQSVVASERLPADRAMALLEATVRTLPPRVLGSASYQVGKMDVLNGTPALFLILLMYGGGGMLSSPALHDRFLDCLQTLVGCGLSGPASPLAFAEAVLAAAGGGAPQLQSKEVLWRMWSAVVGPLTDTITQTNEVNQGDALEHNFGAVLSALMFPVTHFLQGAALSQASQKAMLLSWSRLYRVSARCSALVVTAEENICCEELSAKMAAALDGDALKAPAAAAAVAAMLQVMAECVDFSPYTPSFQQKLKSPHTPVGWTRKKNRPLGNLSAFLSLLLRSLNGYLDAADSSCESTALLPPLLSVLSALFGGLALADAVLEALARLVPPLARLYGESGGAPDDKLEKLLADVLGCIQARRTLDYDSELLALLSPLLAAAFAHRNKQIRCGATSFWNDTFANAVSLTYPDQLRPILLQVKQKTPIILPGFQVSDVPEGLGGLDSSESSQLETKISGIAVSSGPKDCRKDRTPKTAKQTKLDFGSPKPPRRDVLEEEASIDFVFIPPEAKERVLTEHQKEMKRTKRVDIPAMYNNLDASLDTATFSQYTQSQEDSSLDKLATQQVAAQDSAAQTSQKDLETQKVSEVPSKDEEEAVELKKEELSPDPDGDSEEGGAKNGEMTTITTTPEDAKSEEVSGLDASSSSDLVSGTPQKLNSRRQSFITLEKYSEGKSGSPSTVSSFTGPLAKTSRGLKESSQTSPSQDTTPPLSSADHNLPESPRRPKESLSRTEPVKLTERLRSDTSEEGDVIPDTPTESTKDSLQTASVSEEVAPSSQDEETGSVLDDSQSSVTGTGGRRLGRLRVLSLLPGEDAKKRRSQEGSQGDSAQSRRSTRSQQAAEEMSRVIRTRSKGDEGLAGLKDSQGKRKRIKLYSSSEDFLGNVERGRRSSAGGESSQTESVDSQSPKRRGRPRRDSQIQSSQSAGSSQESKPAKQTKIDHNDANVDSQVAISSSEEQSQESAPAKRTKMDHNEPNVDSQSQEPDPVGQASQSSDDTNFTNEATDKALTHNRPVTGVSLDESQSQEVLTPSSESQSQRRSRRVKVMPEVTESQEQSNDSQKRQTRSNSQTTTQAEVQNGGRTKRRKSAPTLGAGVEPSKPEPSDAKESSVIVRKKGKKHGRSLPTALPETETTDVDIVDNDASQKEEVPPKTDDFLEPEVLQVPHGAEVESRTEVEEAVPQGNGDESPVEQSEETSPQEAPAEVDSSGDEHLVVVDLPPPPDEATEKTGSESSVSGEDFGKEAAETSEAEHPEEDPEQSQVQVEEQHQPSETPTEEEVSSVPVSNHNFVTETLEVPTDPTSSDREELSVNAQDASVDVCRTDLHDSPLKPKDLEAVLASDLGQSPSGSRTRGTWSPSASPSSSILKKSQKRQLEVDSPSPLVKSRRVSFANPIQQQETADDIDRRSPAIRTSSPRRSKGSGIPQPKLVTTPTKGLLILSPRNLHSPGYKSSKKCLISEMSREPRPVSKHCIFPALVGCPAPVEAVLPQISNMWSRGFGQLVRARNIKTVGDLSALTPTEVKTLPIRSPKISNVKKALQNYEQQRKGRSGDELKSFDETERMTSEVEETSAPQTADEDDRTTGETLATALPDEQQDVAEVTEVAEVSAVPLLSDLQALSARMAVPAALSRCSPRELADAHELLGGLMRGVVKELMSRTGPSEEGAGPVP